MKRFREVQLASFKTEDIQMILRCDCLIELMENEKNGVRKSTVERVRFFYLNQFKDC